MADFFSWFDNSLFNWCLLIFCSLLIGMSKAGLTGIALVILPIMAYIFGGKVSTGLMLPMLIVADFFSVHYYHRHASWRHIFRIMPWVVPGILTGLLVGNYVSDTIFKKIMAICILVGIIIMLWQDLQKSERVAIPDYGWFALILGITGGFATMMGNAAGPIMSIYLLAMHLPKYNFIGTRAWFFFLVNLFKLPLHIFFWKTIHLKSLSINLLLVPFVIGGVFLGIQIVKIIPEKTYRVLVMVTTVAAAILLL